MGAENSNGGCSDFARCMEILQLILDNEADESDSRYFRDHIEGCMTCFQHYEMEQHIRQLIKTQLVQHEVPMDLINQIRDKIARFEAT